MAKQVVKRTGGFLRAKPKTSKLVKKPGKKPVSKSKSKTKSKFKEKPLPRVHVPFDTRYFDQFQDPQSQFDFKPGYMRKDLYHRDGNSPFRIKKKMRGLPLTEPSEELQAFIAKEIIRYLGFNKKKFKTQRIWIKIFVYDEGLDFWSFVSAPRQDAENAQDIHDILEGIFFKIKAYEVIPMVGGYEVEVIIPKTKRKATPKKAGKKKSSKKKVNSKKPGKKAGKKGKSSKTTSKLKKKP